MDYEKLPIVEAIFVMSSKTISTSEMSCLLDMKASRERGIEDWPDVIKFAPGLPDELRPRYEWSLSSTLEFCHDINDVIDQVIGKLHGKVDLINDICKEHNIKKSFTVVIHYDSSSTVRPYIGLGEKEIDFLHDISAPIGFDIYDYCAD